MNKNEIILKIEPLVGYLVKKYNFGKGDEDLHSEGMITAIICINNSLNLSFEQISRRVMVGVSNRLINIKKKATLKKVNLEKYEDQLFYYIDINTLLLDLPNILNEKEILLLEYLVEGKTRKEICNINKGSRRTYFNRLFELRRKINEYLL